ncbi:MAG: hypothetical protein MK102_11205 [Fuerstiella sp.]|nr:hypothetical protein [Fuerstiella sp.]
MRPLLTGSISHLTCIAAAVVALSGCGETSGPPASPSSVVRQCLETSGTKLDDALASGEVLSTAREIAHVLDDFEDSYVMTPYEEFHEGIEVLEDMASKHESDEELKEVIEQLKELAAQLLSENEA